MQREVGTSGHGSLSVSLRGQWFLAQDVVAGKPDYSGMLCLRVLGLCSPLRPGRELSVLPADCEHPRPWTPLPHSRAHWIPCNLTALQPLSESHDTLLGARVFRVPNHSRLHLLVALLPELYISTSTQIRGPGHPMGPTSISVFTDPPASHTLPHILCSVTTGSLGKAPLLSSSECAGQPGTRAHLQPLAGLEPPVLTPEQHLYQASGPAPPKLREPGPEKGTAPSLLPFLPITPRIQESPPTLSPIPLSPQPRE